MFQFSQNTNKSTAKLTRYDGSNTTGPPTALTSLHENQNNRTNDMEEIIFLILKKVKSCMRRRKGANDREEITENRKLKIFV